MVTQSRAMSRGPGRTDAGIGRADCRQTIAMLSAVLALGALRRAAGCRIRSGRPMRRRCSAPLSVTSFKRQARCAPVTAGGSGRRRGPLRRRVRRRRRRAPAASPPAQAARPLIPAAIALEMTECDVVKRAGAPRAGRDRRQRARRAHRHADLSSRGARPGIYRFAGGRLTLDGARARAAAAAEAREARKPKRRKPSADRRRGLTCQLVAVCSAAPAASHSSSACASAAALLGARLGERRGLRRIAREQAAVGERRVELVRSRA